MENGICGVSSSMEIQADHYRGNSCISWVNIADGQTSVWTVRRVQAYTDQW